jgi:hypothetical protein
MASVRVVTFFHELYATGKPWQRAFWTSGRQRAAAIRVARASDALATNREQSARWLERQAGLPTGSVPHLPICSNVGEPTELVPWDERPRRAVTFGGARFKTSFLTGSGAKKTALLCKRLRITELNDIGQESPCDVEGLRSAGVSFRRMGYLPATDVASMFMNARVALLDYFPSYLSKSGVLAAAAASGTPPIMLRGEGASDGLVFGESILSIDSAVEMTMLDAQLSKMSCAVVAWYRGHNLTRHAELHFSACGCEKSAVCDRV